MNINEHVVNIESKSKNGKQGKEGVDMAVIVNNKRYDFSARYHEYMRQRIDAPVTPEKKQAARERLARIGIIDESGNLSKNYRSE